MGTPSMGHATQLGIAASGTATQQLEFISCDVGKQGSLVASPGIRGTRSHVDGQYNAGTYVVSGSLVMEPRPDELADILPYILGANANGTTFALAEALQEFDLTIDKVAKVYTYADCKVNRARFRSAAGQNLQLTLEIEGLTETQANAGTFPSIANTLSTLQPYIHHQCVLTLASTTYDLNDVEVVIDNGLLTNIFHNSQAREALPPGDRRVTLLCNNPFTSDEIALYDLAITGVNGSLVYTNGNYSLTFTFANLKTPARGAAIPGKGQELPLRLEFTACKTAAADELVIANDSTA